MYGQSLICKHNLYIIVLSRLHKVSSAHLIAHFFPIHQGNTKYNLDLFSHMFEKQLSLLKKRYAE